MDKATLKLTLTAAAGVLVGVLVSVLGMRSLSAQQTGIQRVLILRTDVAASQLPTEAVLGTAEIPAGTAAGRHTHPGLEIGYVLNGEARLEIEGEAPRNLKAGDGYLIPAGKAHDAKVTSSQAAKVVAFYLVEKGKPLSAPAS